MTSMEWPRLLCTTRLGQTHRPARQGRDFLMDNDRIIFSSAFRRLQDKTQVFPLAETDYVRTRLTHSLEAANIGRTLGTEAGNAILADMGLECGADMPAKDDFGTIVATACLAHDIGNPPFGHSGEEAIREWFRNTENGRAVIAALPDHVRDDFLHFEGNAQGFRILNRLQYPDRPYGMRLTCATLGAFMKYPCDNSCMTATDATYKKFGVFVAERGIFAEAAGHLGLPARIPGGHVWARHPLAYLVEAADDISYSIADLEGGFRRKRVTYDEVYDLLSPLVAIKEDWWKKAPDTMREATERVEFLRALAIGGVVQSALACFMEHLSALLQGTPLPKGLTAHMDLAKPFKTLRKVNYERVYQDPQVVEIEAAGFEVMDTLLNAFGGAVFHKHQQAMTARDKTLIKLLPSLRHADAEDGSAEGLYHTMLEVTDFVSGMTDTSAVSLYKKLAGMTLTKG